MINLTCWQCLKDAAKKDKIGILPQTANPGSDAVTIYEGKAVCVRHMLEHLKAGSS